MRRYEFIRGMAVGGSLLLTVPILFNSCSKEDDEPDPGPGNPGGGEGVVVDLADAKYAALAADGGFVYVGDIIVIRVSATSYIALSKICTHQQCTVSYNSSTGRLPCPCHGSLFDSSGNVLNGPATSPLKKYSVTLANNKLIIK